MGTVARDFSSKQGQERKKHRRWHTRQLTCAGCDKMLAFNFVWGAIHVCLQGLVLIPTWSIRLSTWIFPPKNSPTQGGKQTSKTESAHKFRIWCFCNVLRFAKWWRPQFLSMLPWFKFGFTLWVWFKPHQTPLYTCVSYYLSDDCKTNMRSDWFNW